MRVILETWRYMHLHSVWPYITYFLQECSLISQRFEGEKNTLYIWISWTVVIKPAMLTLRRYDVWILDKRKGFGRGCVTHIPHRRRGWVNENWHSKSCEISTNPVNHFKSHHTVNKDDTQSENERKEDMSKLIASILPVGVLVPLTLRPSDAYMRR